MSATVALVYYGGLTVLFFFWIYGIVSFVLDVKNRVLPAVRRYLRGRRVLKEESERERERRERERELY